MSNIEKSKEISTKLSILIAKHWLSVKNGNLDNIYNRSNENSSENSIKMTSKVEIKSSDLDVSYDTDSNNDEVYLSLFNISVYFLYLI